MKLVPFNYMVWVLRGKKDKLWACPYKNRNNMQQEEVEYEAIYKHSAAIMRNETLDEPVCYISLGAVTVKVDKETGIELPTQGIARYPIFRIYTEMPE